MKKFHSAIITFCFAGAICLVAPKAHAQNIVMNPGFEDSNMFPPKWSITDPDPMGPLSVVGTNPTFAHSGNNYAALGTGGNPPAFASLNQSLTTTAGGVYTLSFWLAHDQTGMPTSFSNTFQVIFGGVVVQTLTNVGVFGYQQFTFANLLGTGTSTALQFRFVDTNDFFRLDDVSVVRQNVPESGATAALLALPAFAGLLLLHSRLRTKKSLA